MSSTYSTAKREKAAGQVFSTLRMAAAAPPPARPPVEPPRARAVPPQSPPALLRGLPSGAPGTKRFTFALAPLGLPLPTPVLPDAKGQVTLTGRLGDSYRVEAQFTGLLPPPDPAIQPALWLMHDLTVPTDLNPADLAALPKGMTGAGNWPGDVFTLDGNPPTYGLQGNTIAVTVSPGRFAWTGNGLWRLESTLDQSRNQTFHPLYLIGPEALADINQPVPSGTVASLLTDLFMRQATIHPELPLRSHFRQRLIAVTAKHLGPGAAHTLLDGSGYSRAAVSLEGLVRPTPTLMPTRESCILVGPTREES